MADSLQNAIQELREELSNTFGIETLAHDTIGKELNQEDMDSLAENYVKLRKLAWAVISERDNKILTDSEGWIP